MSYYKLINNQNIIGVISQTDFRKYQSKHNLILISDIENAQYVEYKGIFYHDDWMKPVNEGFVYTQVAAVSIDEEEYNALIEAFETDDEIPVEEPDVEPVIEPTEDPDITLEFVKEMKLKAVNAACEAAIIAGVDVLLSDGETHHFSMQIEDQINLMTVSSMASSGVNQIPYHADGELCKYYTAQDILAIINKATAAKSFHTTYVNSLRAYINSLETISDISAVQYGMTIPVEYQSDILKQMLEAQNAVAE